LYFDTSAIPDYGRLGGISTETLARIDEIAEKKNPRDFALWKFNDTFGWPSPWGQGFPGWHIECSAMSQKYLGETFDIHTGGIDHIAIHHNNEIAQSEHATGKPLAHIWMHRAFINMNGEKIAKSTDNIAFLSDIIAKGISPLSFRYSILSSHYRTTSDFSFTTLDASEQALESIVMALVNPKLGSIIPEAREEFLSYINDDLNTPKVLAQIHSMLNAKTYPLEDIKATIYDFDTVLGLRIKESVDAIATMRETAGEHIRALLSKRAGARDNKDWALSDEIRDILLTHRIRVTDTPEGQEIWPEKILS